MTELMGMDVGKTESPTPDRQSVLNRSSRNPSPSLTQEECRVVVDSCSQILRI